MLAANIHALSHSEFFYTSVNPKLAHIQKSLLLVDPWDNIAKVSAWPKHMGAYCTHLFQFDVVFLNKILARKSP